MIIEKTYNIPLRKGFIETARYKKTKKAVSVLKEFLARHMRVDIANVKIGKNLNTELWKHGIKNPPHHVKVNAIKDDDGMVKAELLGFKYEHKKKEQKEEAKQEPEKKKQAEKTTDEKKPEKTLSKESKHEHKDHEDKSKNINESKKSSDK
jgi:large subunit ribosomal protein L31e